MNWLNKIREFFESLRLPPDIEQQELEDDNDESDSMDEHAMVAFYLDDNGEVFIECKLPTSIMSQINYGILLSKINDGMYAPNIHQIIQQIGIESPDFQRGVRIILESWKKNIKKQELAKELEEKDIVHPLHVFGASRIMNRVE